MYGHLIRKTHYQKGYKPMTNNLKFHSGGKVTHPYFGSGIVRKVYAVAQNPGEETEYTVKIRGERYPATLGEHNLTLR